jgi:hypothetical protein
MKLGNKKMTRSPKKIERPLNDEEKRNPHASGLTASRLLFARVDRLVSELELPSRGDFMNTAVTEILNMCESHKKFLPKLVSRYDGLRKPKDKDFKERWDLVRSQLEGNPSAAQKCGTHFTIQTEQRIAEVVKRIGWSRNQFISEALRTLVDMCENPEARRLPLVVILYDAAVTVEPYRLKT